MAHRKTLTEAQLDVLKWIGAGSPPDVMPDDDYSHRITAAALRRRGLVAVSGRGPSWTAQITSAGEECLAEAEKPEAPRPRQANTSVTQQLIDEIVAAGGAQRFPRKWYGDKDGVDYESRANLAIRHGKVPLGKRLLIEAVSSDEVEITLADNPEGAPSAPSPVPVPERVARFHSVVRQFRDRQERHEVSRAALSRASRILHALVVEAERRGHEARLPTDEGDRRYGRSNWNGQNQGHVVITADGCATALRISEQGLPSRAGWERGRSRYLFTIQGEAHYSTEPLTKYEAGATGRLQIEAVSGFGGRGRPSKWTDRKRQTLEEQLPQILFELELRAAEEREREREAESRRREWEAAMEQARERHAEACRAEVLKAQAGRWHEAEVIRAYCDAAERSHPDDAETAEWISWARAHADSVDPLATPPRAPAPSDDVPAEELRPYLDGWSPHGPDRGW